MPFALVEGEPLLWERWRGHADLEARDMLVNHYRQLARVIAATWYGRRHGDDVDFGDYYQLACVGLLEAVDRFDPGFGVKFRTFASKRIEGAVLDGLASLTERQQQNIARARLVTQRLEAAKASACDGNADAQPAPAKAARTPEQALAFIAEVGIGLALGWLLEDTGMVETGERLVHQPFYRGAALKQLRERLHAVVAGLPRQQHRVIHGHYLQGMPFESIAEELGLSRGRISQLHHDALARLRESLQGERAFDSDC